MKEKDLLKLKDKVDSASADEQQYKGQRKEILSQLKDEFACDNAKQAKKAIKTLETERDEVDERIEKQTKAIEKKYIKEE